MSHWLLLGGFGAMGAIARALLSTWLNPDVASGSLPWGTIAANLIGCFVLGVLAGCTLSSNRIPENLRAPIMTGFLGSFTTFSTFGVETVRLLETGAYATAAVSLLLQVVGGLALAALGLVVGRALCSTP